MLFCTILSELSAKDQFMAQLRPEAQKLHYKKQQRQNQQDKPMQKQEINAQPNEFQQKILSMTPEEFSQSLHTAGIRSRSSTFQQSTMEQLSETMFELTGLSMFEPTSTTTLAQDNSANTSSGSLSTSVDDQHTKNLKKRAVIALAVFLPLLLLSYIVFFACIFFFIPGSNRPSKPKVQSKTSKGDSDKDRSGRDKGTDRDDSSKGGSKTGSHTKNHVSTTM